jgi:hypothetical protein
MKQMIASASKGRSGFYRRLQGHDDLVSVRIGDHYRALGLLTDGAVAWLWVGPHAEYDQLIRG